MGRRDTVTDSLSGTWTYGYDAFGNQTSVTRTVGNTAVSSIHYEYDDQDRLKRTYTNKTDTRYTYDQFGRLSTVTAVLLNGAAVADSAAQDVSWYGQTIHGDNTTYYYDPIGNLDAQKNPGGSTTDYQYDQDNRLTEVDQFVDTNNNQTLDNGETVLGKFVYTLNDDGSRSQVDETDDQGNTRTTNWFYDADNRLIAEAMDVGGAASTAEDYITEYTYDLVGNRMSKITDNTLPDISTFVQNSTGTDSLTSDDTVTYSYDNNDRLLTETDNATGTTNDTTTVYGYGTDGESTGETSKMVYQGLTSSGTILSQTTYSYDAQGRMSQVQIDGNGGGAFETTTSYKYDDEGIRVEQTVTDNTGTKTYTYTIDSNNLTDYAQVLEEYVNNVLNKSYVIGTDVIAQTAPNDGTTLPSGTTAGQLLTLMYDGHGSTRALLNGLTVIQRFVYDAYGNQLSGVTLTSAVMALTNLLYSGEQFDAKIAMQYLRGRFYDPSTDRFGSFDTFENDPTSPFSLHKYLYANADPVDNDDPTGHFTSLNGLSAQAQITRIYIADHPGDKIVAGGVWSWLSNLKPDIQDYTTHEWLEVKPLTPTGLSDAVDAIFKYAPAAIFGWLPDHLWSPSTKTIWVNGQPEAIFNAGGIVFYGDQVELTAETVLGISLLTARTVAEYLPRIYELVGAGQRAIQLALGPGLDSDLGIATLNGELGAI
jgi:RHS repeat-associated protein